jgi:uncharacterized membrane protein YcaP (DUF421 family)
VEDIAEVKRAAMEADGEISILKFDGSMVDKPKGKSRVI